MRTIKNLAYLVVFATLLFACKATVDGEQKKFNSVKNEISGLSATYPRYTPVVDAHLENLDAKWSLALKTTDEDARVMALQAVNASAKSGKIQPVYDLKKEIKSLEDNITFMEGRTADEVEIAVLREIDEAHETLREIKGKVAGSPIEDVNQAAVEINGFIAQMKEEGKYVAIAVKRIKDKEAAEKAALAKAAKEEREAAKAQESTTSTTSTTSTDVSSSNAQTQTTSASTTQEVKMVKCKYCKTSNPDSNSKCKSCGAAL